MHTATQYLQSNLMPLIWIIASSIGVIALVKAGMRAMVKGDTVRDKLLHFARPLWAVFMMGVALNSGTQYMETLFRFSGAGATGSAGIGALLAEAGRQISALQGVLISLSLNVGIFFLIYSLLSTMLSTHDLTRREHMRRGAGVFALCIVIAAAVAIVPWVLGLTSLGGWVTNVR